MDSTHERRIELSQRIERMSQHFDAQSEVVKVEFRRRHDEVVGALIRMRANLSELALLEVRLKALNDASLRNGWIGGALIALGLFLAHFLAPEGKAYEWGAVSVFLVFWGAGFIAERYFQQQLTSLRLARTRTIELDCLHQCRCAGVTDQTFYSHRTHAIKWAESLGSDEESEEAQANWDAFRLEIYERASGTSERFPYLRDGISTRVPIRW